MSIIGIDIDGILARFNNPFADILTEISGVVFPQEDDKWPNTWDWDKDGLKLAGLSDEVIQETRGRAWKEVRDSNDFWENLPPYPGANKFLTDLDMMNYANHSIYFITQRSGDDPKYQTEIWLDMNGFLHPTVLISGEKGEVCHALKADFYIDDKIENCEDVQLKSPATRCYMLARPWNHKLVTVPRIDKLSEFMEVIKNGK